MRDEIGRYKLPEPLKTLFGSPIPDGVKQLVEQHGQNIKWVLDRVLRLR
jgi:hypothetical protein